MVNRISEVYIKFLSAVTNGEIHSEQIESKFYKKIKAYFLIFSPMCMQNCAEVNNLGIFNFKQKRNLTIHYNTVLFPIKPIIHL